MTPEEKVAAYEVHLEDLIRAITARRQELEQAETLDDFQQGRQLAYWEVMDMIQTRHQMILALIDDSVDNIETEEKS